LAVVDFFALQALEFVAGRFQPAGTLSYGTPPAPA